MADNQKQQQHEQATQIFLEVDQDLRRIVNYNVDDDNSSPMVCPYGIKCYRKNCKHIQDYHQFEKHKNISDVSNSTIGKKSKCSSIAKGTKKDFL